MNPSFPNIIQYQEIFLVGKDNFLILSAEAETKVISKVARSDLTNI